MKHNKLNLLILMLSFGFLGSSCAKKDIDVDLTATSWKVEKIRNSRQLIYTNTDSTYILRFLTDEEYTLSLDVNACTGQYEIPDKGNIEIHPMACTEICCDSDFAEELVLFLPKMTSYYARENVLNFIGDGEIILQPFK